MARRPAPAAGAPEWIVTFADLMSLLLCFFILLISFSTQDKQKVQIVAGSMREAFGTQPIPTRAGIIEPDGVPERVFIRNTANVSSVTETAGALDETAADIPNPNKRSTMQPRGDDVKLEAAANSIRSALRANPELAELSHLVHLDVTDEGLEITIVDQDGRSMFGAGMATPVQRLQDLLVLLAPQLRKLSNDISVSGFSAPGELADDPTGEETWRLSGARAVAIHAILAREGIAEDRFAHVAGRGPEQPFFPEEPALAANRRVTITLHSGANAAPLSLRP